MSRTRLAIVGLGKIARDQHVPSLMASPAFELVAVASPHSRLPGVPNYADLAALLKAVPDLPAVALCTTPQVRFETARMALEQGCHVLLEKPPGMTTSEVQVLEDLARSREVALYASWHSRYANGVEPARAWLQGRQVRRVEVVWKEDVRVWHPGQRWIWKAGGLGVFDPGINALSILSRILPGDLLLHSAELFFPGNCETPIAAQLQLTSTAGAAVHMALDFLHTGRPAQAPQRRQRVAAGWPGGGDSPAERICAGVRALRAAGARAAQRRGSRALPPGGRRLPVRPARGSGAVQRVTGVRKDLARSIWSRARTVVFAADPEPRVPIPR